MRVLVTGGHGFLGTYVCKALERAGHGVDAPTATEADLRDPLALTEYTLGRGWVDAVVHLAKPHSNGIGTMRDTPATFAAGCLQIDLNVIRTCAQSSKPPLLLCVGSVCAYPLYTHPPTVEAALWQGYPETVNAPYGLAKRMQLAMLDAYRTEYNLQSIYLLASNIYGPGDRSGHVIPATIQKMRKALSGVYPFTDRPQAEREVVIWGRPDITRSFLYVEDAAEGIVRALAAGPREGPLNLCAPGETPLGDLVHLIAAKVGYWGEIRWDGTQPVGHERRVFSTERLQAALNWVPKTPLAEGLSKTVDWGMLL